MAQLLSKVFIHIIFHIKRNGVKILEKDNNNLSSTLNMHTEIHKCTRFGLIKYNGITGYFVDFLGQILCAYGFPKLGFDNFPISCPKFHWIISIVLQKFRLYIKKLSEAVKIFKVELRLIDYLHI